MKFFNVLCSIILSVTLICSAIIFQFSFSLKHNFFSKSFYLKKFDSSRIYDKYDKSIDNTFSDYTKKNGLPKNTTENMISADWVQIQFETVLDGLLSFMKNKTNNLPVIDTSAPTKVFENNLRIKLQAQNTPIDNSIINSKKDFYKSYELIPFTESWNNLHGNDFKKDLKNYRKDLNYLNAAIYLSIIIVNICIILLLYTTKELSKWKLWTGYSLIIGGIIPSISGFIISNSDKVNAYMNKNISFPKESVIPPNSTINLMSDIVNDFIMGINKYSAIFVILGIAIITIISIIDSKNNNVFWYKHKPLTFNKNDQQ